MGKKLDNRKTDKKAKARNARTPPAPEMTDAVERADPRLFKTALNDAVVLIANIREQKKSLSARETKIMQKLKKDTGRSMGAIGGAIRIHLMEGAAKETYVQDLTEAMTALGDAPKLALGAPARKAASGGNAANADAGNGSTPRADAAEKAKMGREAFAEGKNLVDNPYVKNSPSHDTWMQGFLEAEAKAAAALPPIREEAAGAGAAH